MMFSGGHCQWSGGAGHWRSPGTLHSQQRSSKASGFHCKIQVSFKLRQALTFNVKGFFICDENNLIVNSYNPYDGPNDNPELELPLTAGEYIYVYGDMDDDGFYEGKSGV